MEQQKKKRRGWVGLLAAVLVLALGAWLWLGGDSSLIGAWQMDEVTSYVFYDRETGAMVLPSHTYDFRYTTDESTLTIDFTYEGAKDAVYTFTLKGDILTLSGGNEDVQGTYTLNRIIEEERK